jgi:hypothetical protein
MFRGMYWPLIVGFIAFVLLLVLIGWAVDRPGSGAGGGGKSSH